jgi:hypothetical protein
VIYFSSMDEELWDIDDSELLDDADLELLSGSKPSQPKNKVTFQTEPKTDKVKPASPKAQPAKVNHTTPKNIPEKPVNVNATTKSPIAPKPQAHLSSQVKELPKPVIKSPLRPPTKPALKQLTSNPDVYTLPGKQKTFKPVSKEVRQSRLSPQDILNSALQDEMDGTQTKEEITKKLTNPTVQVKLNLADTGGQAPGLLSCADLPSKKRRRIPGPAGALNDQEIADGNPKKKPKVENEESKSVYLIGSNLATPEEIQEIGFYHDFKKGPWLSMLFSADLPPFRSALLLLVFREFGLAF